MLILVALAVGAIDDDSDNDNKPDDDENDADDCSGGGVYNANSCDVACDACRLEAPAPANRAGLFIK